MSGRNRLRQFFTVAKYSLFSNPASVWLLPAALCLFVVGMYWRLYFDGKEDALFFQALSLAYCWYIYIMGVLKTLNGLRKNTSCFFDDNIKALSFFVGFLSSGIIHLLTFIFLAEINAVGFLVVVMCAFLFFCFSGTWNNWHDIFRLNMVGLIPFVLCSGYLNLRALLEVSIIGFTLFCLATIIFLIAVTGSYYRMWMNKPKNFNLASEDYTVSQSYYRKGND